MKGLEEGIERHRDSYNWDEVYNRARDEELYKLVEKEGK